MDALGQVDASSPKSEMVKSEPKTEYDAISAVNVLDHMIGSYGSNTNPSFYSPYAFHTFNHYYNQQRKYKQLKLIEKFKLVTNDWLSSQSMLPWANNSQVS